MFNTLKAEFFKVIYFHMLKSPVNHLPCISPYSGDHVEFRLNYLLLTRGPSQYKDVVLPA